MEAEAPGVRRAGSDDLGELTALWIALTRYHAELDPLFALRPGAEAEARRILEAQLADPDSATFVAPGFSGLEGFATVRVDHAPPIHPETCRGEISDLFVARTSRRRGLGRTLVAAAHRWARAHGAERLEVRVSAHNELGRAFWRAEGYGLHMDVLHRRL